MLLDLLSIGTPPIQNSSSALDILSPSQANQNSVDMLGNLSTPSPAKHISSPVSPMMDLLDSFGPSPSLPGVYRLPMNNVIIIFSVKN